MGEIVIAFFLLLPVVGVAFGPVFLILRYVNNP